MNKPEERVIIGEGERAGLPISAPVYEVSPGQSFCAGALRWRRRSDGSFTLERNSRDGNEWYEVPLHVELKPAKPEPSESTGRGVQLTPHTVESITKMWEEVHVALLKTERERDEALDRARETSACALDGCAALSAVVELLTRKKVSIPRASWPGVMEAIDSMVHSGEFNGRLEEAKKEVMFEMHKVEEARQINVSLSNRVAFLKKRLSAALDVLTTCKNEGNDW